VANSNNVEEVRSGIELCRSPIVYLDIHKARRTIESCLTVPQLVVAIKYAQLMLRKMWNAVDRISTFGPKDIRRFEYSLDEALAEKAAELKIKTGYFSVGTEGRFDWRLPGN